MPPLYGFGLGRNSPKRSPAHIWGEEVSSGTKIKLKRFPLLWATTL
jgi:hypothetical protein